MRLAYAGTWIRQKAAKNIDYKQNWANASRDSVERRLLLRGCGVFLVSEENKQKKVHKKTSLKEFTMKYPLSFLTILLLHCLLLMLLIENSVATSSIELDKGKSLLYFDSFIFYYQVKVYSYYCLLYVFRVTHYLSRNRNVERWKQEAKHEIAHLKEVIDSQEKKLDQKLTKELDQRMMVLKEAGNPNLYSPERVRHERPYRLLPLKTISNDGPGNTIEKDDGRIVSNRHRFYGPPTNCFDLSQLGFTLNSFYLVQLASITTETKLETIYCAFAKPEGTSFNQSIVEKRALISN